MVGRLTHAHRPALSSHVALHTKGLHGNRIDGHTLRPVVVEHEALTRWRPAAPMSTRAIAASQFRAWSIGQERRVTKSIRRENKGRGVDRASAVLAAAGYLFSASGVDPVKPDTLRVETGCTPGVSDSPAENGDARCCSPPSRCQREQGRQRHLGLG
jgi:hypothetical protein